MYFEKISKQNNLRLIVNTRSNNKSSILSLLEKTNNNNQPNFNKTYLCIVCNKNGFYKCPKCGKNYCCVDCYKKHSSDCTEKFYKKNVEEYLKGKQCDPIEVNKTKELLSKFKNEEEVIDEIDIKQNCKYKKLALKLCNDDFDPILELTSDDWREFQLFLKSQELFDIINEGWLPFWNLLDENNLKPCIELTKFNNKERMEFLEKENINSLKYFIKGDNEETEKSNFEELLFLNKTEVNIDEYISLINTRFEKIPPLKKLTKVIPNIKIFYGMISVVICTIYLFDIYMGDILENVDEVVGIYSIICPSLFDKANYDNLDSLLKDKATKISLFETNFSYNKIINIMEGLLLKSETILTNKFYFVDCLLRVYDIIHFFEIQISTNKEIEQLEKVCSVKNKLIFYLSYLKGMNFEDEFYKNTIIDLAVYKFTN